ncbi:SDR family NAD(P)-dependent oxidoreductase [Nocardioides litoris]|uniref:SDR family NAD(P)-dependent oxidoreductase n=1 Tax=Nocardioides litoris TaxID=1926648 RepID=UPI001123444D|nr:SDR family NAD(P)-dependent oxidoreductase [Nocardioides litoris]
MVRAVPVRPWPAPPRQDGRRFVVTGANSGVGLETTRALVRAGAHVMMACRDEGRGATARDDVLASEGRAAAERVEVGRLDVADLASVRDFADGVGPVDVVVGNAGVLGVPFGLSPDGVELHLATNHLGHVALALRLLPRLTDRVVVVSSVSHRAGDLRLDDLDWSRRGYSAYGAYAASKLANLLFLAELQRRLTAAGSTLRATGAHPGSTATAITASRGGLLSWVGSWGHGLVGMSPTQGAAPVVVAATADLPGGTYLGPHGWREMRGHPVGARRSASALDPELAARAWERWEEMTGLGLDLGLSPP